MDNDNNTDRRKTAPDQDDQAKPNDKLVVLAVPQEDERAAFAYLLAEMNLQVEYAASATEILQILEDRTVHLLVLDMQLPDIHAWKMIRRMREIDHLRDLPVIVITDKTDMGMTVAKVDHLTRPVSIARLRYNVQKVLGQGGASTNTASR